MEKLSIQKGIDDMSKKEEVIQYLSSKNIDIDNLGIGIKVMGWTVRSGAFESYLESSECFGLVESTIYQSDVQRHSKRKRT